MSAATEDLILQVMATKRRLDEHTADFPKSLRPSVRALSDRGLATATAAPSGEVRVKLTQAGIDLVAPRDPCADARARRDRDESTARRERDREEAQVRWERSHRWVGGLRDFGDIPAVGAVQQATDDVAFQRRVTGQGVRHGEAAQVAVRVVSAVMADQIQAAASAVDALDRITVAWITAGLRCTAQPFCAGCPSCQTITAPTRVNVDPPRSSWS